MKNDWLSIKEAAQLIGYSPNYFRRTFCQGDPPLIETHVFSHRMFIKVEVMQAFINASARRTAS
jgi:hypothetical protein